MLSTNFRQAFEQLTNLDQIEALAQERFAEYQKVPQWVDFEVKIQELFRPGLADITTSFDDIISVRSNRATEQEAINSILPLIMELIPWRKGPWNMLDTEIDAEWQSNLKWDRFKDHLGDLEDRRVVDIGCNNGYYLFRMLAERPRFLLGLDPSIRCYYQFELFRRLIGNEQMAYLLFGIDEAQLFSNAFDLALCMGVIYHRRDPHTSCRMLYECLKPAGRLIFESIVIPGNSPVALCPVDRYAQMRNVWFVPTVPCMLSWLEKAGFQKIELLDISATTPEEQRTTRFSPYQSLTDYLDPEDPSKTVEGYPAPQRAIVTGYK